MRFLGIFRERCRNFFDGDFPVAVGLVEMSFHGHQIDHTAKRSFMTDGQLQRDDIAAENRFQRFHGPFKTGQVAIHSSEYERARNVILHAIIPDFFGGDLRAHVRIDSNQRGVRGDQRGFRFGDERGVSG